MEGQVPGGEDPLEVLLQEVKSVVNSVDSARFDKSPAGTLAHLYGKVMHLVERLEDFRKGRAVRGASYSAIDQSLNTLAQCKLTLKNAKVPTCDEWFQTSLKDRDLFQAPVKTVADKWELLPAFVKARGLVNQHIESFDHFLDVTLERIRKANERVKCDADPSWYLQYTRIRVGTPTMEAKADMEYDEKGVTPQRCRMSDLTYSAPIFVKVEYIRYNELVKHEVEVEIGRMPIMLRSKRCVLYKKSDEELARLGECPLDPGGYFVVRGQERVILMQEQLAKNRILVDVDRGFITASVTSSRVEIKSRTSVLLRKGKLYLKTNKFTDEIPLVVALMALGVESTREVVELVGAEAHLQTLLLPSCLEAAAIDPPIRTSTQALQYIGQRIRTRYPRRKPNAVEEARDAFQQVVLAHIPAKYGDFRMKAIYLCVMARRVLQASEDSSYKDDKDYYGNKRLELAGDLMALLFENVFKNFNRELQRVAQTHLSKAQPQKLDIMGSFNHLIITNGLRTAVATGNWNLVRFNMERAGITQVLSRLSYMAMMGMMGRIRSQFEKSRKISGPRALQGSQWGVVCPTDTPEGETCGLVKNLALLTHITINSEEEPLISLCYALGTEDIRTFNGSEGWFPNYKHVFLNGNLLGVHRDPERFMKAFRDLRRCGKVNPYLSISCSSRGHAVSLSSDQGRICRPLIIVRDKKPLVLPQHYLELARGLRTFDDCVSEGLVEFMDVQEEGDAHLVMYERDITDKTTHLEIEPLTILGIVAGLIPYPHHNQSPRNTYQCAMGKQSMGAMSMNQFVRMDTMMYLLVYPHKPLVTTKTMDLVHFDQLPAGHNTIIAVMSFTGYDIEDAVILNQASVDRGFGRCIFTRTHSTHLKRDTEHGREELCEPAPMPTSMGDAKRSKYQEQTKSLDEDGVCRPGSKLNPRDTYLTYKKPKRMDAAGQTASLKNEKYKSPVDGVVDQVVLTNNDEGDTLVKVRFRNVRIPEIGDKFSSRHGQKGVVGLIVPQQDMPFTDQGIVPDLVMNPHGFPSRMTVGKMLELIGSKAGVFDGNFKYGTAFGGDPLEELSSVLLSRGFHYRGKEYVTSGITGEPLNSYIFFGPVYYQKLKHMVYQKVHARSKGPIALLTRQPTEGRARDGGLRLGEMERDCLIAYGGANLLLERLMISSDAFTAYVCEKCGLLAYQKRVKKEEAVPPSPMPSQTHDKQQQVKEKVFFQRNCSYCQEGAQVVPLQMPYACKLLLQELTSMGILPSLRLSDL